MLAGAGLALAIAMAYWLRRSITLPLREAVDIADTIAAGNLSRRIVATMTGEIADCYASRREGVTDIVAALTTAARSAGPGCSVGIYLVDGTIVSPEEAVNRPLEAAASNWHAVARLAGGFVMDDFILVRR